MKTSMRFEGGKELAETLQRLPLSVSKAIKREVLLEAAEPMVAVARRMAPREPGAPDLADNIEVQSLRAGKDEYGDAKADAVAWGPVKGFFYAYFLEWGTVKMSARAFMRPAFDGQVGRSLDIIRLRTWEHIRSYVVKLRGGPS